MGAGNLGTGGHDRHIYLSSNKFCQRIWSADSSDPNHDGGIEYRSCTDRQIDDDFNHLVYVLTESEVRQYINGILEKKITAKPSEFWWRDRFIVGHSYDALNTYFIGILDEFRYYNRVLSDTEIMELYQQYFPQFISLGDVNNNSSPEIAVVAHDAMQFKTTATVKNAQTGTLVKLIPFNGQFVPTKVNV